MDLGGPQVQHAIEHVLEVCYVLVLIVEPNCRATGPNSYFNKVANRSTWAAHHNEDLPRIKFYGGMALKQNHKNGPRQRRFPSSATVPLAR